MENLESLFNDLELSEKELKDAVRILKVFSVHRRQKIFTISKINLNVLVDNSSTLEKLEKNGVLIKDEDKYSLNSKYFINLKDTSQVTYK